MTQSAMRVNTLFAHDLNPEWAGNARGGKEPSLHNVVAYSPEYPQGRVTNVGLAREAATEALDLIYRTFHATFPKAAFDYKQGESLQWVNNGLEAECTWRIEPLSA